MITPLTCLLASATLTPAHAAEDTRPVFTAQRIAATQQPVIDGDIEDAIWQQAEPITRFYQIEPVAFSEASERTEVRLLQDDTTLYVSLHVFDSEPDKITATVKSRDGVMPRDDFVRIMLDPHQTRRDGYIFEINALGGRTDGLLQNNSSVLTNWNTLWRGQSRRTSDGWTAELAIPFRALSFDEVSHDWGFDVIRQIKRKSETNRLVATDSSVVLNDISLSGSLTAPQNISRDAGLDIQLYGIGRYAQDWTTHNSVRKLEPSATAYYKFTPSLTGTLTYNPDFSDTPLDTRRVNTTRFSLFDAETREFFLQDATSFEFGGRGFSIANNGQPFFSRNIGLANGQPVDVQVGGKLSGEIGQLRLGLLSAQSKASDTLAAQTLSVARLSTSVLDESSIGMIVTHGDPSGATRNTVSGADFQYRNSSIAPGKRLLTDLFVEHSESDVYGRDNLYGIAVVYPNEPWYFDLYAKQIGRDFRAPLGFVNRTGVREYNSKITRKQRLTDSAIRSFDVSVVNDVTTNLDDRIQSQRNSVATSLQSRSGDSLGGNFNYKHELLDASFTLPGGLVVPGGSYYWQTGTLRAETSAARPLFASWSVECCDFYDGKMLSNDVQLNYRPTGTYDIALRHVLTRLSRAGTQVNIHVGSFELGVQFTPDMLLKLQTQYDNLSHRFRALLRYKWEPKPGTEVFAAIGEDATIIDPLHNLQYHSLRSDAVLRLGHRLQF